MDALSIRDSHAYYEAVSLSVLATCFVLVFLTYNLGLAIYRLFFSPLSKFPGPKLAAVTFYYEIYFDLFHHGGGQFTWHIKHLHERYGPIIRINPVELHIDDLEFYSEIYCSSTPGRPIDKVEKLENRFGTPRASVSTARAELHRERRGAIAPFFSKQRIQTLNGLLTDITERVSYRLSTEYAGTGRKVNVADMYSSVAIDVITDLAFHKSAEATYAPDFRGPLTGCLQNLVWGLHWGTHFNFIYVVLNIIPESILGVLLPAMKPVLDFKLMIRQHIADIIAGKNEKSTGLDADHPTLFHDILASSLPPDELTIGRLTDEAFTVNAAGIETTKWALTVATFYILNQPHTHARLKAELVKAMPNASSILPWSELEQLPYLSGCISEGLRLSFGVIQRLQRVNRLHSITYGNYDIPAGTIVGMDTYHMNTNEHYFPDPTAFRPERWEGDPKGPTGEHPLTNYLVSFSRGSRTCMGINLAYMEMFVSLATIFRRHELELFETDQSDVDPVYELLTPMPRKGSKGVRIIVKK